MRNAIKAKLLSMLVCTCNYIYFILDITSKVWVLVIRRPRMNLVIAIYQQNFTCGVWSYIVLVCATFLSTFSLLGIAFSKGYCTIQWRKKFLSFFCDFRVALSYTVVTSHTLWLSISNVTTEIKKLDFYVISCKFKNECSV